MAAPVCICTALAQDTGSVQEPQRIVPQQSGTQADDESAFPSTQLPSETPSAPPPKNSPQAAPDDTTAEPLAENPDLWSEPGADYPSWHDKLFPHFRLDQYFDDNIFIQPTHKTADFVTVLGMGLCAGWGDVANPLTPIRERRGVPLLYDDPEAKPGNFLLADYTGTPVFYANTPSQDTYNQDALLRGNWTDTRLSIGLVSRFQSMTISEIDVGELVKQKVYTEALNATYALTEKTSIQSLFSFIRIDYPDNYISTNDWLHEDWLNYQISPKVTTGPGIGVGLTEIQGSADQTYERLQYRASYQTTEKLSFTGKAGLEFRQLGPGVPSRQYPIFALGASYALFDGTLIQLDSYRDMGVSTLLYGQNYVTTGVDLTLQQRLIQKLHLTLSAGYENLDYLSVAANVVATRNDDYFVGKAAVAVDVARWCTAQVFYNFQRDCSTLGSNSFVDNQVGVEWNFAF